MDTKVEWRTIPGYPSYQASTDGFIRRCLLGKGTQGRILRPWYSKRGYAKVCLCEYGLRQSLWVHFLIARTFLGTRPQFHDIHHKDHNPRNNRVSNLEYLPKLDNIAEENQRLRMRRQAETEQVETLVDFLTMLVGGA